MLAIFFMSFEGPASQSQVLAPFFWFALGVSAVLAGGPRLAAEPPAVRLAGAAALALAAAEEAPQKQGPSKGTAT